VIDERRTTKDERRKEDACHPSFVLGPSSLVVVGYGNPLRGDDAVGPQIALALTEQAQPGVRTFALHQLTPELAEAVAAAHDAIFVDAYRTEAATAAVVLRPITPHNQSQLAGHLSDPRAVLALAYAIYGRYPRAWLLGVPASRFDYGAALSPVATAGVAGALDLIRYLIANR
jgi:hydrogenase maturation protease